jgi:hypothetical protein
MACGIDQMRFSYPLSDPSTEPTSVKKKILLAGDENDTELLRHGATVSL